MYSKDIIKSVIILYDTLGKNNIIGKKRTEIITSSFSVYMNTLYRWKKKLPNVNIGHKSYYNNTKITDEIENLILKSINHNNNFNVKNIRKNIFDKFKLSLSKSTIYFVLHKNKMTYKQMKVINNPFSDEQIIEKKNTIKKIIEEKGENNLISQDEMAIYLNDTPNKGWSIKGKDCIIKTKKSLVKTRFSISMTIDKTNNINFSLKKGSMNQNNFIGLINKMNSNYIKNKILFLDNASIHKSKKVMEFMNNKNINYLFNIPYHSHLNPIEYIFSLLRKKLLSNDIENVNDIIKTVIEFKKELKKDIVENIFNKCINAIYN